MGRRDVTPALYVALLYPLDALLGSDWYLLSDKVHKCLVFIGLIQMPTHSQSVSNYPLVNVNIRNLFFFFFSFIFISWRLITSQHFSGFCHTLTWVSHGVTCIPHPDPTPTSLSTRFLWVFPVHQALALVSCIPPGLVISFTIDNIHAEELIFLYKYLLSSHHALDTRCICSFLLVSILWCSSLLFFWVSVLWTDKDTLIWPAFSAI